MGLLSERESATVFGLFEPTSPVAEALAVADSIHVHIKLDVARAPHQQLLAAGGNVENGKERYVKYAFPGGINVILSSIDVSQDDLAETPCSRRPRPFVDHIGIDLRRESPEVEQRFNSVSELASQQGWQHVPQGAPGQPVFCCHVEVGRKHWAYRPTRRAHRAFRSSSPSAQSRSTRSPGLRPASGSAWQRGQRPGMSGLSQETETWPARRTRADHVLNSAVVD